MNYCFLPEISNRYVDAFFTLMVNPKLSQNLTFADGINLKNLICMHLTKEEQLLATGRITALFRKFAIPGVIGLLFIGLQPMIDGAVLGNFVGTEALASINIFVPIYTFMSALAVVVGVGCQAIVGMALGSKDYVKAHSAFKTAFWSLLVLALVMGCAFVLAAEPLCRFLGANEVLLPYTVSYVRAFSLFFPFMLLAFLCDYMLKAMGRPNFAMLVLGGTVVLNLLLNLLFVSVLEWTTAGSGLATGIAFTTGFAVMAPALLKKKSGQSPERTFLFQTTGSNDIQRFVGRLVGVVSRHYGIPIQLGDDEELGRSGSSCIYGHQLYAELGGTNVRGTVRRHCTYPVVQLRSRSSEPGERNAVLGFQDKCNHRHHLVLHHVLRQRVHRLPILCRRRQPCAEDNLHRSGSLRLRFPTERLEHSVVEFLYLAGRCTHLRTCIFAKRAVVRCAWNHDISGYFRR